VSPTGFTPSAAPIAGGTVVNVSGSGLVATPEGVSVLFGTRPATAVTRLSASLVQCVAPAVASVQTVSLNLSLNGQDFVRVGTTDLTYYSA
jgi:hypothetical protein